MRKRLAQNLFYIIDQILGSAEIIFSRESLSRSLYRLEMLQCGSEGNRYLNRTLKRFEERGFIRSFNRKGQTCYRLTEKGIQKLDNLKFLANGRQKQRWDGIWRVVIWDIPEEKKSVREGLRRKLKYFNFYPLQKSVFVFPFECSKELEQLADYFDIEEYLQTILAKSLGRKENEVREFFEPVIKN